MRFEVYLTRTIQLSYLLCLLFDATPKTKTRNVILKQTENDSITSLRGIPEDNM